MKSPLHGLENKKLLPLIPYYKFKEEVQSENSAFAMQNSLCDHSAIYATVVLRTYNHSAIYAVVISLHGQKRISYVHPDPKIETVWMIK